jgi:hypothetical protein
MSKFSLNHKYNCAGLGGIGRISIPCNICSTFRGQDGIEYAVIERDAFEGSLSLFIVLRSDVSYATPCGRSSAQGIVEKGSHGGDS